MSGIPMKDKKYFSIGSQYKIYDYEKDFSHILEIKGRKGNWLLITIDGVLREARVYPVVNPLSESILLDGYSPVFSYSEIVQDNI